MTTVASVQVEPRTAAPRLLVADDNSTVREALGDTLEALGFKVLGQATDGPEAVAMAGELRPDVVLMDLRMPGLDGIEATRRIKALLPLVQVVILTAYDDPALVQEAEDAGVYCYLVKGTSPTIIRDTLIFAGEYKAGLETRSRP